MTSLADYAASQSPRPRTCAVCNLSMREEIDAALRNGVGPKMVSDWLWDEHSIKLAVAYHKQSNHHMETE